MKARYTVLQGEIVSEIRNGTERDYVPDGLGSTVAMLDSAQQKTDSFLYWPYGELRSRTGSTPTPFQFGGTMGYSRISATLQYIRARHLAPSLARWLTLDSFQLEPNRYSYAQGNPASAVDPTGQFTMSDRCKGRKGRPKGEGEKVYERWCEKWGKLDARRLDAVNRCVIQGNGQDCDRLTRDHVKCLLDWCKTGKLDCRTQENCKDCRPMRLGETEPWGFSSPDKPGCPLILCMDNLASPPCGTFENHTIPAIDRVFIHEVLHCCKVHHGPHRDRESLTSCNNLIACCMVNELMPLPKRLACTTMSRRRPRP